ncbi:bifunctional transcriptional activator/DNA repair enzyme AdaA [Pseudobacillus badius]|uniref:bifunctional transcriptional activator/DNA repair enzyme AdaA n=1 Tax=Bacillus badius TaxID=1455 RepID=UPI003CE68D41
MMEDKTSIPAECWRAIIECDEAYDGVFFYGVQTTGIFCRPSCKSKAPNQENVRIFKNASAALKEQFRPCKRCKPDALLLPAEEWIGQIARWIDQHYSQTLTLSMLAEAFHGSPFYLQRLFKQLKGLSPAEYLQQVRLKQAMNQLEETEQSIALISSNVGFSSTPYFITLFKRTFGCTPSAYRKLAHNKKVEE